MKMLVTAASRHGSTDEIAGALADALRRGGADVDLLKPEDVHEITDYDTVVIGSAIYIGRWLPPAKEFIARFREALLLRQVWLFSSGPVGNNGRPVNDPPDVSPQVEATGAREHRMFAGKLDRTTLGFGERMMVRAVRAPEGDFRDWESVNEWAEQIRLAHQSGFPQTSGKPS
ncbi:flavodoxin domain-containing protein [Rhodococcus qingshengii]|uniref:flavodoxin domain-containing protein n=1 Tax=Rhodococcus qingshengii TaxID=334542 RepID=UPI0024BA22D5|nr:flavodoxin domain-containing protein [Rhodococcus qingshengii]MDJ0441473.1 flavodoxin domain-containing protein [Rhodococcus qingshengii]